MLESISIEGSRVEGEGGLFSVVGEEIPRASGLVGLWLPKPSMVLHKLLQSPNFKEEDLPMGRRTLGAEGEGEREHIVPRAWYVKV